MPAEPARSVQTTWLYTLGSIVFFFGFLDLIVVLSMLDTYLRTGDAVTAVLVVLLLVATAMQLRYCWFLRVGRGGGLPSPWWTAALVAPAAAVWVVGLFSPGDELAAAVPLWAAATLIACLLPKPQRRLVLLVGLITVIAHPMLATAVTGVPFAFGRASDTWMIAIFVAMLPVMLLTSMWWWEVVVQLDRHRRTAAELAVTQERLRFASDLHDIQGHHLQVISLKSELAERMLEIDPAAARELVHETRLIAKQALEETRSLVAGYRHVAFDDELENAREVLTASGAECALRLGPLPADALAQSALASVVREATTNILRHSEATTVTIELTTTGERTELAIVNDGVPVTDASAPGSAGSAVSRAPGSGLAGLRERLAAVGGTLETATDASGARFELRATVPVGARVTA
ncbi:sensor histidine kinase [Agromyces cerinus]|uniref:Two-component system, NarL family, sensor histidine kinase DesK n=1 Tax=Agromyces cerinus subsp. cerinus TaxID=232089 RepID=A0A1N6F365_9MICO|nr:histidine kinase [Agromyces cerinus]SIN89654.1 two-component system, NarL family, sensor histidine kinase DesK [Agromyces cerinus subsp. cerinus]